MRCVLVLVACVALAGCLKWDNLYDGWDGGGSSEEWNVETTGVTGLTLNGVWASSANDIYVVGESGGSGYILHSNGNGMWLPAQVDNGPVFNAVAGCSDSDIYAVANGGQIWHSTGNGAWTPMTSPVTAALQDVWCVAPSDVFAVGPNATIVRSQAGGAWTRFSALSGGTIFESVHGNAGKLFAAGRPGAVYSFDYGTGVWTPESSGRTEHLYGVATTANRSYVVGDIEADPPMMYSVVITSTGNEMWAREDLDATSRLSDIAVSPSGTFYIATGGGKVFVGTGGAWHVETTPVTNGLTSIFALSDNEVWATSGMKVVRR